eukprot:6212086-Pleurochrysis_carterae.AAC.3
MLSYPTLALHTFLASKPLTQWAISRYPSDIAVEAFPNVHSHHMRTCGALALHSQGSRVPLARMADLV